jgi:hypothetical protein
MFFIVQIGQLFIKNINQGFNIAGRNFGDGESKHLRQEKGPEFPDLIQNIRIRHPFIIRLFRLQKKHS